MNMDASEKSDPHDRVGESVEAANLGALGTEQGAGLSRRGLLRNFIHDALLQPGDEIGPYKLLRVLGEGGGGIVYLAEQSQPIRRQVALKVVKPGMDSRQVLARFEAEQQALARMEHPHVARVHDAGLTPGGRPYFVMEYVQGTPITDYCDERKLAIEERLQLFLHVCEAVQHAHQKGIIHRDLKPSNILVTVEDEEAVPKVIDFGVARAISQPLTDHTLYTEQGQLVGTPEYMSPEQADVGNQDIDTRTDVYSLGVVLYELLAGMLPFDRKAFREGGLEQMRGVIREEEPTTPSTRLRAYPNNPAQRYVMTAQAR
jgi:serine/threonine-protein kinase